MNKINPIFDAVTEIDDKMVSGSITKYKTKPRKALKITAVAAAAMVLLGTAAAAATFGDDPIVKINNKQVVPLYSTYVNENGWTVETTVVQTPQTVLSSYTPVGEVRAVFDEEPFTVDYYDELGVRLNAVTTNVFMFVNANKPGETPANFSGINTADNFHQNVTMSADSKIINIEFWQDPAQALKSEFEKKRREEMTADEWIEKWAPYEKIIAFPGYGGFERPSMREIFDANAKCLFAVDESVLTFEGAPGEVMKLYGYALVTIDGFSEKAGTTVVVYTNAVFDEEKGEFINGGDEIIQQMFVYTLVDEQNGNEFLFTVWRSAENKDVYTDHFNFEYEYITLNNGTQARLHQSVNGSFILEFEKEGAAYGLQFSGGRDTAEYILEKMELL